MSLNVVELIQKGGIFFDVNGKNPKDVYKKVTGLMNLPDYITPKALCEGLCEREDFMSTAVGNGIALPHCRMPILKDSNGEQISIVFLSKPINMSAPDNLPVSIMFIILSKNQKDHLEILSQLFEVLKDTEVKKLLNQRASKEEILETLKKIKSE